MLFTYKTSDSNCLKAYDYCNQYFSEEGTTTDPYYGFNQNFLPKGNIYLNPDARGYGSNYIRLNVTITPGKKGLKMQAIDSGKSLYKLIADLDYIYCFVNNIRKRQR